MATLQISVLSEMNKFLTSFDAISMKLKDLTPLGWARMKFLP